MDVGLDLLAVLLLVWLVGDAVVVVVALLAARAQDRRAARVRQVSARRVPLAIPLRVRTSGRRSPRLARRLARHD